MTLEEAIEARHSVRAYKEQPLAENVVKVLEEKIAVLNREGKLHIQLIQNEPKAFQGTMAKYGKFRNVGNYIVMAGQNLLAPTAVNQQKFSFEYMGMKDGRHQVHAKKGFSMIGYTQMDLGIAKYHFEIGAGKDNFEWV